VQVVTARQRVSDARLYFVCEAWPEDRLRAVCEAGVDLIQLRDRTLDDEGLAVAARAFRAAADATGALFVLNDRPDLVAACGADGVHVGQGDAAPATARAIVGPDAVIGVSTHAPDQLAAAAADPEVDTISVGPVWETPTKPGRPAAGLEYVRHAAAQDLATPWFAIGGIDLDTADEVLAAGARRLVVVRAIRDAADPARVVRRLREALDGAALAQEAA
jgi:thiamine-phosphate pyrophosphorylase